MDPERYPSFHCKALSPGKGCDKVRWEPGFPELSEQVQLGNQLLGTQGTGQLR